jgi:putative SOS response-associated peptidase YedK
MIRNTVVQLTANTSKNIESFHNQILAVSKQSPEVLNKPKCLNRAILTTEANDFLRPIHDRMPVILDPKDYEIWLDPNLNRIDRLTSLLKPYPPEAMTAYPVSSNVNSPKNGNGECKQPVPNSHTDLYEYI